MLGTFLSLSLCLATLAQLSEDQSLKDACESMNSLYTLRSSPDGQAAIGDLCAMQWNVYTSDEQQAREFCQLYAPWRLNKVEYGTRTICHVEATRMCQSGWIQMFGRCLKMPKGQERFTYDQAVQTCANTNPPSQLASLERKYIVGVWSRIFPKLEQTWVRVAEGWEKFYVEIPGHADPKAPALMIVGDHYEFNVMSNSLVHAFKNTELHALCDYEPPVTRAEINYLARRYQEIYYTGVPVSDGVLFRTSSHYQSSALNPDVCKRALKPYKIDSEIGQFVPLANRMKSFDEAQPEGISFSLAHGHTSFHKDRMRSEANCKHFDGPYIIKIGDRHVQLPNNPKGCDNMQSTVVNHAHNPTAVATSSDSLRAPVWCQLGKLRNYTYAAPPGWKLFMRENGEAVAHKFMGVAKTWEDAEAECVKEGAHLSGFDSTEEANFLRGMLEDWNQISGRDGRDLPAWIGLTRKTECLNELPLHGQYNGNPDHPCGPVNVMEWRNDAAHNKVKPEMWGLLTSRWPNPDFSDWYKSCVTIFFGTPTWADPTNPGIIDDDRCYYKHSSFCGKAVKSVEEVL